MASAVLATTTNLRNNFETEYDINDFLLHAHLHNGRAVGRCGLGTAELGILHRVTDNARGICHTEAG
jgi:hypothetical protein